MQLELDEKTKKLVIEQAKKQLLVSIIAQFDIKQIAAEVKNSAIKEARDMFVKEIQKSPKLEEYIQRATETIENRVNKKLASLLENGIKISLKEEK